MRRAWTAGAVLLLLCAAAVGNGLRLEQITENITASLEQAQGMVEKGSWEEAARVTEGAERRFREKSFYLHVTLRHNDIDQVETGFREVAQLLSHRERVGEYAAANARLISQLELLAESEHFSLHNVL